MSSRTDLVALALGVSVVTAVGSARADRADIAFSTPLPNVCGLVRGGVSSTGDGQQLRLSVNGAMYNCGSGEILWSDPGSLYLHVALYYTDGEMEPFVCENHTWRANDQGGPVQVLTNTYGCGDGYYAVVAHSFYAPSGTMSPTMLANWEYFDVNDNPPF